MARIPPLLYGTAWKGDTTTALVMQAFAAGFRGIDTAGQRKHYREDLVGAAIAKADSELDLPREKLWIQTKYVVELRRIKGCGRRTDFKPHLVFSPTRTDSRPSADKI